MTAVLHVGIASLAFVKARTLAIAQGELVPGPQEPKLWFTSTERFGRILSAANRELLATIAEQKPASIAELARLTGRAAPNLSRTLATMETYGLVKLVPGAGRMMRPEVEFERIDAKLFFLEKDAQAAA